VRDQYRVVPAGIDADAVARAGEDPDPELAALREQHPLVGFCGRLSRQKDPLAFVEAAHLVRGEVGDRVRFVVVGDGPLRSAVDERIGALGLTGYVMRSGLRTDIPRVLSCLDVFVHPSRYEGLPRVILEAFTVGVPVVCTGVGGCPEIARDGETALARAIVEILTNRELGARLCASARAVVAAYDIRRSAELLAELYAGLARPQ
jgi:glycosyltransferase involved in cell wall biosynthesis